LNTESLQASRRKGGALDDHRNGLIGTFLTDGPVFEVAGPAFGDAIMPPGESQAVVFAGHWLQQVADYRGALQSWFRAVRVGGHLVVVVPHAFLYERRLALPTRWDSVQRRLYTPGSLLGEIEEALIPNTYRVRFLGDDDAGYDYELDRVVEPVGGCDVVIVVERIAPPAWALTDRPKAKASTPAFAFEPARTRVEFVALKPRRKILILKLDHLGDFIMGIPALEKARSSFADAELTLVVGSWNVEMARALGIADHVLSFDVFPVNSSEETVDVPGKTALFQRLLTDDYDLVIDLRTDPDTRFLLNTVRADLKAGIGTRAQFPFLDIFLPVDFTRNQVEAAREDEISHQRFSSQRDTIRRDFRIFCAKEKVRRDSAIVWGPYFALRPGRYIFEPYIELDPSADGLLSYDIALDGKWVTFTMAPTPEPIRLPFSVEKSGALFEFRIWAVDGATPINFSFYGGRLIREGGFSVLHQSEYLLLLIELVKLRLERFGVLGESPGFP
jgi:hypothetical protein